MILYFAGAEVGSWRKLLEEQNVSTVALSYMGLRRRVKFARPWIIDEKFPKDQHIFLDSGGFTVNKEDAEYTREELLDISDSYMAFVHQNLDRVDMVSEFDALALGYDYIKSMREDFYDDLGERFLPIWHYDYGLDDLDTLASQYERVGIPQVAIGDRSLTPLLNKLVSRYGVKLHGVAMTKMDIMTEIKWDSVSSTSWISPSQYGDTIVWTKQGLSRFPKKSKDEARKRHRTLFTENGFDADKILNDDRTELLKLSLWSWGKFVDDINRKKAFDSPALVTNLADSPNSGFGEQGIAPVDNPEAPVENAQLVPQEPEGRPTVLIPLMQVGVRTVENEAGETVSEASTVEMRSDSLRMCNTCVLQSKCPAAKANANCAYNIPIVVKTAEELKAVEEAIITMQTQRVLFMKMSEDLDGGYADPNLSKEIVLLNKMIAAKRAAEDTGFSFTLTAKEKGNTGRISRLFGDSPELHVAERLQQLESPRPADEYLSEAGILDAEVIDP